jgi:hypothetical protein
MFSRSLWATEVNTFGADQNIFYGTGTSVMDIGVLGNQTLDIHPDGSTTRVAVSDTSMQLHYDNILIGKDDFSVSNCDGGDITFKMHYAAGTHGDVPFGNIGYGCQNNYNVVFEAGGPDIPNNGWQFDTLDNTGTQQQRFMVVGGASATNGIIVGRSSTLVNAIGAATVVSCYDTGSCAWNFSNGTKEYDLSIITGYSSSLGLYLPQANLYAYMIYPNGHIILNSTNDDGVNELQVTGGLALNSQTSGPGSSTATLTNAPSSGNPAFWIPITINGTVRHIPAW